MPSCMLMNPLLYVESVVEALKPFDTFVIESELLDILQTLTEAKYNMFFNKAENDQKLQQAVKKHSVFKLTYSGDTSDYWMYTGMLKKNVSLIPQTNQNTYF